MPTKIGDLAIYLSASTSGLAGDLSKASGLVLDFSKDTQKRMAAVTKPADNPLPEIFKAMGKEAKGAAEGAGRLRSALAGVFTHAAGDLLAGGIRSAAGGMKDLVASSLDLAAAAEVSETKFAVMLGGSAERAKDLSKELRALAAVTPLSTADANRHAASLLSAGVEQEQVAPWLAKLSDIAPDKDSLAGLVRAYGQVRGMGRVTGGDWLQINNAGGLTMEDMAKSTFNERTQSMGVDVAEYKKLQEQGRITFQTLQQAIITATSVGGRSFKQGEKYAETYAGKLDKLKDDWEDAKRTFGQVLIEEFTLKDASDQAGSLAAKAKEFAEALRPAVRMSKELAKTVGGAVGGLYGFGQKIGALLQGEYGTITKGEEAKARDAADEWRAKLNVGKHGLSMGDAYNLGSYVDLAEKEQKQVAHHEGRAKFHATEAADATMKSVRDYHTMMEGRQRALAEQAGVTAGLAWDEVRRILGRGDPTKVTLDQGGKLLGAQDRAKIDKLILEPRLAEMALKLQDQFIDPLKKFADDMRDLDKIKAVGKITDDVHAFAVADLVRELGQHVPPPQLAPTVEAGSQQLATMIGLAGIGNSPQDVKGLLESIRLLQEQQLNMAKRIAANTGQRPQVMTMPE